LSIFTSFSQLNFYSFRKINRERNVWIYKHNLFHRDRPEELYLVRRRTCPGVDGRKQRFSRLSAQRLSSKFHDNSNSNSDAEDDVSSSGEDASVGEIMDAVTAAKRKREAPPATVLSSKKPRSTILPPRVENLPQKFVELDTSVVSDPAPSPTSVKALLFDNDEPADDSSTSRKHDRMEMMQQSLVVSEVASKLEEYVKKAMKEKGLSRTRRGGSGIVTPPFGTSGRFTMNSSDLITYDDEYDVDEGASLGVVSDADDSMSVEDTLRSIDKDMMVAPVTDVETVKRIRFEILRRANASNEEVIRACANVAAFFMLTAPNEEPDDCCPKILELLSTSTHLEAEFYFYRSALHPSLFLDSEMRNGQFAQFHSVALRNSLSGGTGRLQALREFKVFSVNLIYKLLGVNGSLGIEESFTDIDHSTLLRTAKSWSKSVGIGV
jgi:hypothetical protein